MRTFILTALALCLAVATQACRDSSLFPVDPVKGGKPTDSTITQLTMDQIIGQQWQLQSYGTVGGVPTPIPAAESLTLTFDKKSHLGGDADCNSYGADYAAGANHAISITNIVQTKVFCGNDKWDREYLLALGEASTWDATSEALHIYYHGGHMVLNYVKAGTIKPGNSEKKLAITDLPAVTWKLTSMETIGTATTPNQAVMVLNENYLLMANTAYANHISGTANCNTYDGRFTTGSDYAFTVSDLSYSKFSCADEHYLDAAYFAALSGAQKAVITIDAAGTRLDVSYDDGKKILHYTIADAIPGSGAQGLKNAYGSKWEMSAIGKVGGVMEPPKGSDPLPWIMFSANGTVEGSSYCSPYSGFFQEDAGNQLSIFNITWRFSAACQFDEIPVLNVLMTAVSYDLSGDTLIINAANDTRAVFIRK